MVTVKGLAGVLAAAAVLGSGEACSTNHIRELKDFAASEAGRKLRGSAISGTYCTLDEQSPINLPSLPTLRASLTPEQAYSPIEIEFHETDEDSKMILENLGGTIEVVPEHTDIYITHNSHAKELGRGVDVNETYQVAQFHFHWDTSFSGYGSEHYRGGEAFPIEMHIVSFNTKYGDIGTAVGNDDGLLVIGIFGEKSKRKLANEEFSKISDAILEAEESDDGFLADAHVELEDFSLETMISSIDLAKYDSYKGSLTTPSCNQIVSWVVMHDTLKLSAEQIRAFQKAHKSESELIAPNYREIQARNGRTVHRSQILCDPKDKDCRLGEFLSLQGF
ncbi:Carbonic anhydrase [Hondaea fermentalgiana]|uniref:carbonic anhydrase n=1 Tax=Hondaea fermentalgiana TaxID=2315210 RepID=A0A2R5GYC5_9STRA|nr:Carbonic anhydrase [Hondaea fermentalgiana]|eukprot:GBG33723.1 Carbonic anhydrase [Hondaea fermentalgiana]